MEKVGNALTALGKLCSSELRTLGLTSAGLQLSAPSLVVKTALIFVSGMEDEGLSDVCVCLPM